MTRSFRVIIVIFEHRTSLGGRGDAGRTVRTFASILQQPASCPRGRRSLRPYISASRRFSRCYLGLLLLPLWLQHDVMAPAVMLAVWRC